MNKYEFLTQLEEQLRGSVSNQEVRESVSYYQSYIEEEMRKGRTEEEIFEDIGSANTVAKSIIDARGYETDTDSVYEQAGNYGGYKKHDSEENGDSYYYDSGSQSGQYSGYHSERNDSNVKVFRTDGWRGTAILIGIVIVLIMLLVFAFRIIAALVPFLVPFALVLFLIKMVTGKK